MSHVAIGCVRYPTIQVFPTLKCFLGCRYSVMKWDGPGPQGYPVTPHSYLLSTMPFTGSLYLSVPSSHAGHFPLDSTFSNPLYALLNAVLKNSPPCSLSCLPSTDSSSSQGGRNLVRFPPHIGTPIGAVIQVFFMHLNC